MNKELATRIEQHALGHFLTDWSGLTYAQVLDILREEGNAGWVSDERIMVWEPFEDCDGSYIADNIESLHAVLVSLVADAYQAGAQVFDETNSYLISRIEDWSDEQWDEVVSAVEDTVVAVADSFGRENKEEN